MDPQPPVRERWDPAIDAILVRARRLTAEEIVALARGDRAPEVSGVDRTRVLDLAAARAGRPADVHELRVAIAASLGPGLPRRTRHALVRLGFLDRAERVAADAALAILLRDRLGPRAAVEIARPWSELR
jgi:hypothetical protein